MSSSRGDARGMAELLRSGARMLSYNCPECGSPLFQLKSGEIWCAKCQKRVVIVSEAEGEAAVKRELVWESLETTLIDKLSAMNDLLYSEADPERVKEIAEAISLLLGSIERLRRVRRS